MYHLQNTSLYNRLEQRTMKPGGKKKQNLFYTGFLKKYMRIESHPITQELQILVLCISSMKIFM